MSDFDFIAWSLAAGGIAAVVLVGISRIVLAARGKSSYSPKPVELALSIVVCLTLGGMIMRLVADLALHVQPPRWSVLLFGVMLLVLGVSNLITGKSDGTGYSSTRTFGYVLVGLGVLLLALDLVDWFILKRAAL